MNLLALAPIITPMGRNPPNMPMWALVVQLICCVGGIVAAIMGLWRTRPRR